MLLKNKKIIIFFVFILLLAGISFALKWFITQEEAPSIEPSIERCTDSDGGKNYYVFGYTSIDGKRVGDDYCMRGTNRLIENFCDYDFSPPISNVGYDCPNGCQDGACLKKDTDKDGMDDEWEDKHGLDKNNPEDSKRDPDDDGLTNIKEFNIGTDPTNEDTDNDNIKDGDEVIYETDPLNPDSDNDGMDDGWEIANELNPILNDADKDPDEDESANLEEYQQGTDPHNEDTDGDGVIDGKEGCIDSDEGKDYYVKGYVEMVGDPSYGINGKKYDVCVDLVDGQYVTEYYCQSKTDPGSTNFKCPKGCKDGACLEGIEVITSCAEYNKGDVSSGYQSHSCEIEEAKGFCPSENYCYFNGYCFETGQVGRVVVYDLDNDRIPGTICAKGTKNNWLYDCDTTQYPHYCERFCGYNRAMSGEDLDFGEYTVEDTKKDVDKIGECCGDDFGENYIVGEDGTAACCDSPDDSVKGGVCYEGIEVTTSCAEWDKNDNSSNDQSHSCNVEEVKGPCPSENYCYFNDICFETGYVGRVVVHDLDNDRIPGTICAKGTGMTWLYDCDTTQYPHYCERFCGYNRAMSGEDHDFGEYTVEDTKKDMDKVGECCGDDFGENYIVGDDETAACCDSPSDFVKDSMCYEGIEVVTSCAEYNKGDVSSGYQSHSCEIEEAKGLCPSENYCYFNGYCFETGSVGRVVVYDLDNDRVPGTVCAKGTGMTWLYDCDTTQYPHYCESFCGYNRAMSGEERNFGEYTIEDNSNDVNKIGECCGDDFGENYIVGEDGTAACCDSPSDFVKNSKCYEPTLTNKLLDAIGFI